MKSMLFVFIFACFVQASSYAITKNISVKIPEIKCKYFGTIYYELTLESMFDEKDRSKYDKKLLELNAAFVIDEVDYKKGKVIVKMARKAPYDDVKYAFDQIGLRVISELEIVK